MLVGARLGGVAIGAAILWSCAASGPDAEPLGRVTQHLEEQVRWTGRAIPLPDLGLARQAAREVDVAWNGSGFIVFATESFGLGRALVSRLSPALAPLDTAPTEVDLPEKEDDLSSPRVACQQSGWCLLVWQDRALTRARLLSPTYELGAELPLQGAVATLDYASAVATNNGFILVGEDYTYGTDLNHRAVAATIDLQGNVVAKTLLEKDGRRPRAAFNGSSLLMVSATDASPSQLEATLWSPSLDALGIPVPLGIPLSGHAIYAVPDVFSVASDGQGFAVMQHGGAAGKLDFRTIGADLSLGPLETFAVTTTAQAHLVRAQGGYALIYRDDGLGSLYRRFRTDAGAWSQGTLNVRASLASAVAFGATSGVVLMLSGEYSGLVFGRGLKGDGAPSGPTFNAMLKPAEASQIGIASSSDGFAVSWIQDSLTGYGLRLSRAASDGTLLAEPPIVPHQEKAIYSRALARNQETMLASFMASDYSYWTAVVRDGVLSEQQDAFETFHIVSGSEGFLSVGYHEVTSGSYYFEQHRYIQRRDRAGELLDAEPIELCVFYGYSEDGTGCGRLEAASSGSDYLVHYDEDDGQRQFLIVRADGSTLPVPPVQEAPHPDSRYTPFQAIGTEDGFLVWRGLRPPILAELSRDGVWGPWRTLEPPGWSQYSYGDVIWLGDRAALSYGTTQGPVVREILPDSFGTPMVIEPSCVLGVSIPGQLGPTLSVTPSGASPFVDPTTLTHCSAALEPAEGGAGGQGPVLPGEAGAGGKGEPLPSEGGAAGQAVASPIDGGAAGGPTSGGAGGSAGGENNAVGGGAQGEAGQAPNEPSEAGQGNSTPSAGGAPSGHAGEPAAAAGAGAGDSSPEDDAGACQCQAAGAPGSSLWGLLLVATAGLTRRRRSGR